MIAEDEATAPDRTRVPLVRTLALPSEANLHGGIFGGWILAELDKAAGILAMELSGGPATTVAIEKLAFASPLTAGDDFRIFGTPLRTGRTSMTLLLEGWAFPIGSSPRLVVHGTFVSVAIDLDGRPRPLPKRSEPDPSGPDQS